MFVSGLKSDVSSNDLRNYFTGCKKITLKRCRATSYLQYCTNAYCFIITLRFRVFRYAFVLHRTSRDAKHNLQRAINYNVLGPKCCIEYANNDPVSSYNYHSYDKKTIMVSRIPDNVCKNDLHRLFIGCRTIKYYPARYVHRTGTATVTKNKNKLLLG